MNWGQSPHSVNEWALATDESVRRSQERRAQMARRRMITTCVMLVLFVIAAFAALRWAIPALV